MSTLKNKTVNAIQWSYFSLITGLTLQLVFAAVLARLLTPEEFGVVAMAILLQRFGQFIADLGIGQALVQKPELTDEDVRAALTSSIVLGLTATLLAWALSPIAGLYFHNPDVVTVFQGYASTYVLLSLIVVSTSLLRRALRFRPVVISELTSYVLGHGVIGLSAAYLGYGAFSLVISTVAQYVIQLAIVYAFVRHPLHLTWRWDAYRHLYAFGSRMTVANFLEFVSSSLDVFMLGRLYDAATVGLYNRAYSTVNQPMMNFAVSLTRVLAPSFSAVQSDLVRLRRGYHSALLGLGTIMFAAAAFIYVDAREIVLVLLGEQFAPAIPVVQVFALFIPFMVLANLHGVLAEATARLAPRIWIQAGYLVFLFVAFVTAYRLELGILGFAGALVVGAMLRNVAFSVLAWRIVGGARGMMRAYLVAAVSGAAAGLVNFVAVMLLRDVVESPFVLFALELLLGVALLGVVVVFGPPSEVKSLARRILGRLTRRAFGLMKFTGAR